MSELEMLLGGLNVLFIVVIVFVFRLYLSSQKRLSTLMSDQIHFANDISTANKSLSERVNAVFSAQEDTKELIRREAQDLRDRLPRKT